MKNLSIFFVLVLSRSFVSAFEIVKVPDSLSDGSQATILAQIDETISDREEKVEDSANQTPQVETLLTIDINRKDRRKVVIRRKKAVALLEADKDLENVLNYTSDKMSF